MAGHPPVGAIADRPDERKTFVIVAVALIDALRRSFAMGGADERKIADSLGAVLVTERGRPWFRLS